MGIVTAGGSSQESPIYLQTKQVVATMCFDRAAKGTHTIIKKAWLHMRNVNVSETKTTEEL